MALLNVALLCWACLHAATCIHVAAADEEPREDLACDAESDCLSEKTSMMLMQTSLDLKSLTEVQAHIVANKEATDRDSSDANATASDLSMPMAAVHLSLAEVAALTASEADEQANASHSQRSQAPGAPAAARRMPHPEWHRVQGIAGAAALNQEAVAAQFKPPTYILGGTFIVVFFMAMVIVHEIRIYFWDKAPIAAWEMPGQAWPFLRVMLLMSFWVYAETATIIPLSYDLAVELVTVGSPATLSGLLVSLYFIGVPIGGGIGLATMPEIGWDQPRSRRRLIYAFTIDVTMHLVSSVILSVPSFIPGSDLKFWFATVLRMVNGLCGGYIMIGVMQLGQRITKPSQRGDWGILQQIMRNGGFMFGPGISSIVIWWCRVSFTTLSVAFQSAALSLTMAFATTAIMSLWAYTAPMEVSEGACEEDKVELSEDEHAKFGRTPWEFYPDAIRERVVWLMTTYSVERAFTVAALEVASLMMLDTLYGWSIELAGFVLSGLAVVATFLCGMLLVLLRNGDIKERTTFQCSVLCSVFGAFFLFTLGGSFGPYSLLCADILIYSTCSISQGLSDGWGMRAAKPGTGFSNPTRMGVQVGTSTMARLIAPPLARTLVDQFGRNSYAGLQLVAMLAGATTVSKCCYLAQQVDKSAIMAKEDKSAIMAKEDKSAIMAKEAM